MNSKIKYIKKVWADGWVGEGLGPIGEREKGEDG